MIAWRTALLSGSGVSVSMRLSADFGFPAEREFPVSVVAGHGVLAVATVTLVLFTMLTG